MAGIEQVAKLAGVSTATVSRALSGKGQVSERARAKVEKAVEELGYVPSSSAYTLATGRTNNIGVVLPFIDRWYFSVILEAIETELIERDYDLTLYNLSGGIDQRKKVFSVFLPRKRVDGVLAVAVKLDDSELAYLERTGKPLVGVGGLIPGAHSITIDDLAVGRMATEHLLSLGHSAIACIGGVATTEMDFSQPTLRRNGWEKALKESKVAVRNDWFRGADFTIAGGYAAGRELLKDPSDRPTGIVCASDEMGFGVIMAAKDLGIRVPEDLSVVGVDDHDTSEFYGLTTVSQDVRAQGRHVAKVLIDLLENHVAGEPVNIEAIERWPVKLVVRSSTAKVSKPAR